MDVESVKFLGSLRWLSIGAPAEGRNPPCGRASEGQGQPGEGLGLRQDEPGGVGTSAGSTTGEPQHPPQPQPAPAPPPVPWTTRDVWVGLALLGVWIALSLGLVFLMRLVPVNVDASLIITFWEATLLLPAWALTVRKYRVGWGALGLRRFQGVVVAIGCGLMLLSYAVNLVYSAVLAAFHLRMQADLVPLLAQLAYPWLFLVGGVVVAPLAEEIFFRGFVFTGLRQRYGWQKAAVVSAALFALLHLEPTAILPIFLLGLIFAYLYQRSNSVWPAVLMHAASNALALGAAYILVKMGWA